MPRAPAGAPGDPEQPHQPERSDPSPRLDAEAVRAVMQARGLNQTQLAERLGVGPPHMSMMLSGQRKPSMAVLLRMAEVLAVSMDVLTGRLPFLRPVAGTLVAAIAWQADQVRAMSPSERARRVLYVLLAAAPDPRAAAGAVGSNLDISAETLADLLLGRLDITGALLTGLIQQSGVPASYFYEGDLSWAMAPPRRK